MRVPLIVRSSAFSGFKSSFKLSLLGFVTPRKDLISRLVILLTLRLIIWRILASSFLQFIHLEIFQTEIFHMLDGSLLINTIVSPFIKLFTASKSQREIFANRDILLCRRTNVFRCSRTNSLPLHINIYYLYAITYILTSRSNET